VTGVLWAAAAGIGFGLFQSVNAQAVRRVDDPYLSSFLQLLVAAVVLSCIALVTEDVGRLADAPAWAIASFALAGALHFLVGWTLLNLSQDRIGAARTSPLLTMVPVFGTVVAAVTVGQLPDVASLGAIALMVFGAYTVSTARRAAAASWRDSLFGLGTALMWALSPIFTVKGLDGLDSPLIGVAIGLVVSVGGYALLLAVSRSRRRRDPVQRGGVALKLAAGALVALATWGRWEALDLLTVGVVLAFNLLSVPVVLVLAPIVGGRRVEDVTARVWAGAALVVCGSLILVALG
jgi:drug/metabolite transporter (DMT)-like permease